MLIFLMFWCSWEEVEQVEQFVRDINEKGWTLIPKVPINIDGKENLFASLNQDPKRLIFLFERCSGQFVDRTEEWALRQEREDLLEQKIRDRELIEEKQNSWKT